MSGGRVNLSVVLEEESLDTLIKTYGTYNTNLKELKSIVDDNNAKIKAIMRNKGINTYSVEDWKASYTVQKRESMNEDKLLDLLKVDWKERHGDEVCPYIQTKEYVNFDALEDAIYKDSIPKNTLLQMDSCREVKEVEVLKVTKVK